MIINIFEKFFSAPSYIVFFGVILLFSLSGFLTCKVCDEKENPSIVQRFGGLVAPFALVPTSLFALTSALLGVTVWQNFQTQQDAVLAECRAMLAFVQLTETIPVLQDKGLADQARAYTFSAAGTEWPILITTRERSAETEKIINSLIAKTAVVASHPETPAVIGRQLLDSVLAINQARNVRLDLVNVRPDAFRWLCVILLGFLLQITVAVVHLGDIRRVKVSVTLATLAVSTTLGLIAVSVNTFSGQEAVTIEPLSRIFR